MTQYNWQLMLSDGERVLVQYLLNEHIEKLKNENIPVGLFAEDLQRKLAEIKPYGNTIYEN